MPRLFIPLLLGLLIIPGLLEAKKMTRQDAVAVVQTLPEVQSYLKRVPKGRVEADSEEKGEWLIHVYAIEKGHTATMNWYRVGKKDGKITPLFGP